MNTDNHATQNSDAGIEQAAVERRTQSRRLKWNIVAAMAVLLLMGIFALIA